jgi:putative Mg2+ transporter-C (MgtC) family protein
MKTDIVKGGRSMLPFPLLLLRLALAIVLGGAIGLERELSAHSAGLRTNALVALGSAVFMVISEYGFTSFLGMPHVQVDPSRIASYVVAGIGFLGGGAIAFHREQEQVRGLTTAAAIWIVAALGLACGAGLILEAVTATLLALLVLVVLRWLERRLHLQGNGASQRLRIETTAATGELLETITQTCTKEGLTIKHLEVRAAQAGVQVEIVCRVPPSASFAQIISQLHSLPGEQVVQANHND